MKMNYFNFTNFDGDYLLTNDFGEYLFLSEGDFKKTVTGKAEEDDELVQKLVDSGMAYLGSDIEYSFERMKRLRLVKSYLNQATSLHIFVVTTACNMHCVYCQANNGVKDSNLMMTEKTAEKAVDIALQSPEKELTFEFQGGEPLINFPVIRHIVEYAEVMNIGHTINYSLATNLSLINVTILDFLAEHHFSISTSMDGGREVHNQNRKFLDGNGSYDTLCRKLEIINRRNLIVGAIETTTKASLPYAEDILKTYQNMGFHNIFIRPLTPLGRAHNYWNEIGYTAGEFLNFYHTALLELLRINRAGYFLAENHASMLMKKINGISLNYMELRSPCGASLGQLAYYADGNIYTCDEGRMLGEMGDNSFLLGNVFQSDYNSVINNVLCKTVCCSSVLESIPSCCDCVYQPYCGVCPVVTYATEGDILEKHPRSYKCEIYSGIFRMVFSILKGNDKQDSAILNSWTL